MMWTKEKIIDIALDYPEIATMTANDYKDFRRNEAYDLPSFFTLRKFFGHWNKFKLEVYGDKAELTGTSSKRLDDFIEKKIEEKIEEYFEEKVDF